MSRASRSASWCTARPAQTFPMLFGVDTIVTASTVGGGVVIEIVVVAARSYVW